MPRNSKTKGGRATRQARGRAKSLKVQQKRAEQRQREDKAMSKHRERSRPSTGSKIFARG